MLTLKYLIIYPVYFLLLVYISLFLLINFCSSLSWGTKSHIPHSLIPFFSRVRDIVWFQPSAPPTWPVYGNGLYNAPIVTRLSLSPTTPTPKAKSNNMAPKVLHSPTSPYLFTSDCNFLPFLLCSNTQLLAFPVTRLSFSHVASHILSRMLSVFSSTWLFLLLQDSSQESLASEAITSN